jgi:nicotinate-nucleotide--dimethylbenzimidazole phosphoribosyltransferase
MREPAMTAAECKAAVIAGREAARRAQSDGVRVLLLGEMGIGNTTASAALLAALTGAPPNETVGRGTGVDDTGLARKRDVVARALERHRSKQDDPAREPTERALASLGGLEIAALVGAMHEASRLGLVSVVDGFIVTVAALVAVRMQPHVADSLVFAHVGSEAGHRLALRACADAGCRCDPLLDLDLRLGEASGAVLALGLLRSACALFEMATFGAAGVSGPA